MSDCELGSWLTFALALSAFIFSILCYRMLKQILHHVLKFNPDYQNQIKDLHDEIVESEAQ